MLEKYKDQMLPPFHYEGEAVNFATKRQSELRKLGEGSPVVFSSSPRTDFADARGRIFCRFTSCAGAPIAAEKQTTAAPRIGSAKRPTKSRRPRGPRAPQ